MNGLPEVVFNLAGTPLLVFWFALVFLPKWSWTDRLYRTKLPMLYLAVLYSVVVVYGLITDPEPFAILLDPDLAGAQRLLGSTVGAAAGWVHFLCFDLLVGTLIWRRALAKGHRFLWVSPVLVLTLFLAPLGWLVFEAVSFGVGRRVG
ncbi:MAG: ABA4-like family protein [Planctomycetota bacterium]